MSLLERVKEAVSFALVHAWALRSKERRAEILAGIRKNPGPAIAGLSTIVVLVSVATVVTIASVRRMWIERWQEEMAIRVRKDAEDTLRKVLVQASKNLMVQQTLGAFNVIDSVPPPQNMDPTLIEEYVSVVMRVASALIEERRLEQAERLLNLISDHPSLEKEIRAMLDSITVRRWVVQAEDRERKAREYLEEKKWVQANFEFGIALANLKQAAEFIPDEVDESIRRIKAETHALQLKLYYEQILNLLNEALTLGPKGRLSEAYAKVGTVNQILKRVERSYPKTAELEFLSRRTKDTLASLRSMSPKKPPIWNLFKSDNELFRRRFFRLTALSLARPAAARIEGSVTFTAHPQFKGYVRVTLYYRQSRSWVKIVRFPNALRSPFRFTLDLPPELGFETFRLAEFRFFDEQDRNVSRAKLEPAITSVGQSDHPFSEGHSSSSPPESAPPEVSLDADSRKSPPPDRDPPGESGPLKDSQPRAN